MKIINKPIVIIGTSHHNTLSMVRCFGIIGHKVDVILYGCDKSYVAKSKMINKCYYSPTAEDAFKKILSLYDCEKIKPIVINCTDEIEAVFDVNLNLISPDFVFFNAKIPGRVSYFMDKYKQVELAEKVGFQVPETYSSIKNLPIDSLITYPYLIKPLESKNGGKKIVICNNKKDLQRAISDFDSIPYLIQNLIIKDKEYVIVGLTVGDVSIVPACIEKHRETNGATTYSTVHNIDFLPNYLRESSIRMVQEIGYEGLWGIELVKSNGNYYFIELNLRNDATTFSVAMAGVNLPYCYAVLKDGGKMENVGIIREINSIVENRDYQFVINKKIGILKWFHQYLKSECKYIKFKDDNKPFIIEMRRIISSLFKSTLHKFHLR